MIKSRLEKFIPSRELKNPYAQVADTDKFEDERGKVLFGFTLFLLSESMIFASLIVAYVGLRALTNDWRPPGVSAPELSGSVVIHSVVLVSSSLVIYLAERALSHHKLAQFRGLWLMTSIMGAYFLVGEVKEWLHLDFGLNAATLGGTFYLLTGFHGLHVFVGIFLQMLMLVRSFIPGNYNRGHFGVTAVSWFWHVVDGIWVMLFLLLYVW